MQRLAILGATGSIGLNTLDVVRTHPDRYEVYALAACRNAAQMAELAVEFRPRYIVMQRVGAARELRELLQHHAVASEVLEGEQALVDIARADAVDTVVAAIVGGAGLPSTMAAVQAGKRVLLANKESLVMAGHLVMQAAAASGACLLPVDSEHNAMFQCLPGSARGESLEASGVRKLILTGSGGPFRQSAMSELAHVTPDQACAHPNWSMGRKISVDSATLMNKGLEFIEACWLFRATPAQIQVVIHPQSIIHSMVEYVDGSVLAQLGQPDMRTPIANCLGWPERIATGVPSLDFWQLGNLEFSAPDPVRFPLLPLAMDAIARGGSYPAALNAANEVAVELFLNEQLKFSQIGSLVDHVMQSWNQGEPRSLEEVIQADSTARGIARQWALTAV